MIDKFSMKLGNLEQTVGKLLTSTLAGLLDLEMGMKAGEWEQGPD